MPSTTRELARAVRRARKARNWTQLDLAERASLAPSTVARIEQGRIDPAASTLRALALALAVSADSLLGLQTRKP